MKAIRFLRTAWLTTLLTGGGFMAVTVVVDPYDYWGQPRVRRVSEHKPLVHTHLAVAKRRQYLRERPRVVIAGNSRVDVGFDPGSPQWAASDQPVYNFGLPGMSVASVTETLAASMAEHSPQRLYLGVDFLDFIVTRDRWSEFSGGPLRAEPETLGARVRRLSETSLSLDALMHAVITVMEQRKANPRDTRRNGFTPLENYHDHVRMEGHAALFEQRSREMVKRLLGEPRKLVWNAPGGNANWTRLEQFLRFARSRGVKVVLFTYPYHAELLETLRQTGRWPEMREWQEQLTALAAREGVTLWSFTGYDTYSTEPVPRPGDRTSRMQWYWEAGHFKPSLGELMIARMLERSGAPADFGRKLTPDGLDALSVALDTDAEAYRERPDASSVRVASYVSALGDLKLIQDMAIPNSVISAKEM